MYDLDKKYLVLGLMTNQLVEAVHDHQQKLPYNPFQNKQIAIDQQANQKIDLRYIVQVVKKES